MNDTSLRQPDIFQRSTFLVDEMTTAGNLLSSTLSILRSAMQERNATVAHRETVTIASLILQLAMLNSPLSTQLIGHIVQEKIDASARG